MRREGKIQVTPVEPFKAFNHVVRDVAPCTSSFSALSAGPWTSSSRRTRSRLPCTLRRPVSHRLWHSDSSWHAHMSHIAVPFTPASRSGYLSRPHRKRSDTGDRCTSSSAPSPVRVPVDTSRTFDHPRQLAHIPGVVCGAWRQSEFEPQRSWVQNPTPRTRSGSRCTGYSSELL